MITMAAHLGPYLKKRTELYLLGSVNGSLCDLELLP